VKKNFMPIRHFRDIADANVQLQQWVIETAGQRTHGSTFQQPLKQFNDLEKSLLKPVLFACVSRKLEDKTNSCVAQ